jgi:hypothetical protein
MALVNPNIALGIRQPEFTPRNAMAEYAQMQQIMNAQDAQQMNALKLQEYQRTREEEEGTRNFLRGRDLSAPETRAGLAQFGKTGLSYAKSLQEQDKAALDARNIQSQIGERDIGTQKKKLDFAWGAVGSAASPEAALAELNNGVKNGVFTSASIADDVKRLREIKTPEEYRAYRAEKIMGILDAKDRLAFMLPKVTRQDTGSEIIAIDDNPASPNYGKPIAGAAIPKTATPGDRLSAETARAGQNLTAETARAGQNITLRGQNLQAEAARGNLSVAQQRLAFEQQKALQPEFNAQAGGFIAPPTKENPQGVFIPATGIQAAKDQGAAVKALKSAGYNVETGEDTISKLIAQSTSGGLQAGAAATLAFLGKSTSGRKAIAALEGTANQIAVDLAGGKLGASISNTDRDFIVAALGDVANPNKTAEERLSGWTAAKNRMMLTGLIPPPKVGGAPTTPAAAAPTSGGLSAAEQAELDQLRKRFGK